MQFLSIILLPLLLVGLVQAAPLEKRLTRAKLDQFTTADCGGNNSDKSSHRNSHDVVGIKPGICINIDGATHSIYPSRGRGIFSRKMTAYSETGCPRNRRIDRITEHESGSACMNVDTQLKGVAGSEEHQGRIMSVMFS